MKNVYDIIEWRNKPDMRLWITLLVAVFTAFWCRADVELPTDYRSEQIFLAPQSTVLMPGDTIKLEGVVTCLAADRMLPYSRYLYIELINGSDIVLTRQKIACDDRGYFRANIPTDSVTLGRHYLRAYTRLMRNFSLQSFAQQAVTFSKSGRSTVEDGYISASVHPEGGVLIPDKPQRVTVAVTTSAGVPVEGVSVTLSVAGGEAIGETATSRSGYATFNFIPEQGAVYHATVDGQEPMALPAADVRALKVAGRLSDRKVTFELVGDLAAADSLKLYAYDGMNGLQRVDDAGVSGTLCLERRPVAVTLFLVDGRDDRIVSECTVVNARRPEMRVIAPDTVARGGAVDYSIAGPGADGDAVTIVRMVPENESSGQMAVEALLYTADLRSDLPFPAVTSGSDGEWSNDLAVWAGTARFKRFGIAEVLHNDSTVYRFMPEFAMSLTGRAYRDSKFPMRDGSLVVMNGSNYYTYDTPVSHEGDFEIAVDDFAENTEFFLQYVDKAGKVKRADIRIPADTYPPVEIYRGMERRNNRLRSSGVTIGEEVEGSHRLPDVVVKARATAEKEVSTKRFYGYKAKYREDIEKRHYRTLLDIIQDMPTLIVIKDTEPTEEEQEEGLTVTRVPRWIIRTQRGIATFKGSYVRLLIDGILNDDPDMMDIVLATPAIDIESVEYLTPVEALGYVAHALDGAIIVTTRQIGPEVKRTSKGTIYRPAGLSPVRSARVEGKPVVENAGRYKMIVDVIGKDGIYSMEHPLTVTE